MLQPSIFKIQLKKINAKKSGRTSYATKPIVTCSIGLTGKERKSNYYNLYVRHLFGFENINWKYVEVGFFDNNLLIGEGTESDFLVSGKIQSISSKNLCETIFNFFNVRIPKNADEFQTITLECIKFDRFYKLVKA